MIKLIFIYYAWSHIFHTNELITNNVRQNECILEQTGNYFFHAHVSNQDIVVQRTLFLSRKHSRENFLQF